MTEIVFDTTISNELRLAHKETCSSIQKSINTMLLALVSSMPPWEDIANELSKSMKAINTVVAVSMIESINHVLGDVMDSVTCSINNILAESLLNFSTEMNWQAEYENLVEEEKLELEQAVREIVAEPKNIQQKLKEIWEKFKDKNPVLAWLCAIIAVFIINQALLATATMMRNALVRESPSADAQIINNITINQTVVIVGDAPYYYEIEYEDEETEETNHGWVLKRLVKPIDYAEEVPAP